MDNQSKSRSQGPSHPAVQPGGILHCGWSCISKSPSEMGELRVTLRRIEGGELALCRVGFVSTVDYLDVKYV